MDAMVTIPKTYRRPDVMRILRRCNNGVTWHHKVAGDHVFPADVLERDFRTLPQRCRELGLRFYCAENRLRPLGDSRCCCGIDGLSGFRTNRANLNSLAFSRPIRYTKQMEEVGTAWCFKSLAQDAVSSLALRDMSYRDAMHIAADVPVFRSAMGLDGA